MSLELNPEREWSHIQKNQVGAHALRTEIGIRQSMIGVSLFIAVCLGKYLQRLASARPA